jgi:hypothetical protein
MLGDRLLKRWRENYYFGNALATVARPMYWASQRLSLEIAQKVRKNGVAVRLPNGQKLRFGRDAGVNIASLLFWKGVDGYEPDTLRR